MTGFCPGDASVRCCPEPGRPFAALGGSSSALGDGGGGSSVSANNDDATTNDLSLGACEADAGHCYDSTAAKCEGAGALVGFCVGSANVLCCPPPGRLAELPTDAAIGAHAPCLDGQAGTCMDARTHECIGGVTMVGVCRGDAAVRCCTAPGTPTEIGDGNVKFEQHTMVVTCRTDPFLAIGGTYQRADGNLGLPPMMGLNSVSMMPSRSDPSAWQTLGSVGCHMSQTSLQDGWTACVCDVGVECVGEFCFERDGVSYWQQGACANCTCKQPATAPVLEATEEGASNGWVAAVVVILLLAAAIMVAAVWMRRAAARATFSTSHAVGETIPMTHVNLRRAQENAMYERGDRFQPSVLNPVQVVTKEVWTVAAVPGGPGGLRGASVAPSPVKVAYAIPFDTSPVSEAIQLHSGGQVYSIPSEGVVISGANQQLYFVPSELQLSSTMDILDQTAV